MPYKTEATTYELVNDSINITMKTVNSYNLSDIVSVEIDEYGCELSFSDEGTVTIPLDEPHIVNAAVKAMTNRHLGT